MARIDIPAPMAGSVKEVLVTPGDTVTEGAELLIIESMKMEVPLESPSGGTVVEVLVAEGAVIEEDHLLVRLDAP
jgi:biotin carboxyl carrier protein